MKSQQCSSCGQEYEGWVEFCPHCGQAIENYSRPAGFWIRVGAQLIDALIFIPIWLLGLWNYRSFKSIIVLLLINIPGLIYKPIMESFVGATLGKMVVGIKVVNAQGDKLSLSGAYIRYFPFLIQVSVGLAGQIIVYSSEQFQSASSWLELNQAQQENYLALIGFILNILVLINCLFAAFTYRKRALHDMLAESYCVYKGP